MAKKVRFPLEMEDGTEVRSLAELRENFSLSKVLGYAKDGKLVTWLRDRYENDIADLISNIELSEEDAAKKICDILSIEFEGNSEEEIEKAKEKERKLSLLKKYPECSEYAKKIDLIAFDQDDLYDLLDENSDIIYLCGERFSIPLSKTGVTYIGINNPMAVVDSKVEVDWQEKKIILKNLTFDDNYQKVINSAEETKQTLYEKFVEIVKSYNVSKNKGTYQFGDYKGSDVSFMLSPTEREASENSFCKLSEIIITNSGYDINADINDIREKLNKLNVVGCASKYLDRL